MKKLVLLVMAGLIAATPAMAATKKAKRHAAPPAPKADTRNEDSWRLVRDSLPVWLPTATIPFLLKAKEDQAMQDQKAKPHKRCSIRAPTCSCKTPTRPRCFKLPRRRAGWRSAGTRT